MYKITLFDENLDSFISGVAIFFVEDLELFEKYVVSQFDSETREGYFKSKKGGCYIDYYSDNKDLNMVQSDENCTILGTKTFKYQDKHITLRNFYECETEVFVSDVFITLLHIKYDETYFLIGKYKLSGICRKSVFKSNSYEECSIFGNYIHKQNISGKAQQINKTNPKDFAGYDLETCCYVTLKAYDNMEDFSLEEIEEITDELFINLMRDIPGSCG